MKQALNAEEKRKVAAKYRSLFPRGRSTAVGDQREAWCNQLGYSSSSVRKWAARYIDGRLTTPKAKAQPRVQPKPPPRVPPTPPAPEGSLVAAERELQLVQAGISQAVIAALPVELGTRNRVLGHLDEALHALERGRRLVIAVWDAQQ